MVNKEHSHKSHSHSLTQIKLVGNYCWSVSHLTKFCDLLSSESKLLFTFSTCFFVRGVGALNRTRFSASFDKSGKTHKLFLLAIVEVTGADSLAWPAVFLFLSLSLQCKSCKVTWSAANCRTISPSLIEGNGFESCKLYRKKQKITSLIYIDRTVPNNL